MSSAWMLSIYAAAILVSMISAVGAAVKVWKRTKDSQLSMQRLYTVSVAGHILSMIWVYVKSAAGFLSTPAGLIAIACTVLLFSVFVYAGNRVFHSVFHREKKKSGMHWKSKFESRGMRKHNHYTIL
ncbi:hypothetical protein [Alkalicoccus chagannorensis]|uniref:hypothetical protein n=1 Tax=Alkalicoccus chagannorensis TaxID=427072 RepID=UPI0004180D27|nr:hypothetical protein [Alkalicoccus chagannorensis]